MSLSHAATSTGLRPAPPLVFPPLDNTPRLVEMLSEVLEMPPAKIRKILWRNEYDHGDLFREEFKEAGLQPYVWSDGLERFYEVNNCYVHGSVMWNRRPAKLQMRNWIGTYLARGGKPVDVATVGDGVGFDSLYLALWGHRVTYSEISPKCMKFARMMFAEAPVPVNVVEGVQNVPDESQDAVLCLDVLEHLPDPHWMLKEVTRILRPGGKFFVHAPFFFVSYANPTHLESNRKYSGDWKTLYQPHGLYPIDGHFFWDPLVLVKKKPDEPLPSIPLATRFSLALGGALLSVGRYFNWPHNFVAHRYMFGRDDRWINELADCADQDEDGNPR